MRDGNRLKEKIELRLDQRQVVSFAVVAMLLAGALFALGVVVGKNLAGMPGPKPPPGPQALLDRLDESAGLPDGGPKLDFQEELTKRLPESSPGAGRPAPAGAPSAATAHPHPPAHPLARAVEAPPPPATAPNPTPAPAAVAAAPAPAAEAAPPKLFFTIQVKATQSSPEAHKFVQRLQSGGYQPFVAEVDIPGKGRWYRVRVGHFETRAKADQYLADFERETHYQAFVTAGH
ncbi:MAG: SPOR domain-containing protein [Deltaproteobacteria bacterium]